MLEIITDSNVLSLLTLADFWFYIAILSSVIFLAVQSAFYSTDRKIREMYFCIGLAIFVAVFMFNILLTQRASAGAYRPLLVGAGLYDIVDAAIRGARDGVRIDRKEIERALNDELLRWSWPAIVAAAGVVLLGLWSQMTPPPKWRRGVGVDIMQAEVPDVVDYSIKAIALRNAFISAVLIFASIILFDLLQLSTIAEQTSVVRTPQVFFQDNRFDGRFFIALALGPFILATSIGMVWSLRYRMKAGGLVAYRPDKLRKLVNMHRSYERSIAPTLGTVGSDELKAAEPFTDEYDGSDEGEAPPAAPGAAKEGMGSKEARERKEPRRERMKVE